MRKIVFLGASLLLGACAAAGTQVTSRDVAHFKPGMASEQDVEDALGAPNISTSDARGHTICYQYMEMAVRPETFIPLVGAFAGGADSRTTTTCLRFDPRGILRDTWSSATQTGAGTGIEAGGSTGRVKNEPRKSQQP
jgi:hypothetical protein